MLQPPVHDGHYSSRKLLLLFYFIYFKKSKHTHTQKAKNSCRKMRHLCSTLDTHTEKDRLFQKMTMRHLCSIMYLLKSVVPLTIIFTGGFYQSFGVGCILPMHIPGFLQLSQGAGQAAELYTTKHVAQFCSCWYILFQSLTFESNAMYYDLSKLFRN